MPTYGYRCPKGHEFEKSFPTMNPRRHLKCPQCGLMAERLISAGAGLHFKGSGFYVTDYKRAGASPSESEAKSETKSESKSESQSESKADAKPDKPKAPKSKDK